MIELKQKRVAVLSHVYAPGPPHELVAFLNKQVSQLFFVAQPFPFVKDGKISYQIYNKGKLASEMFGRVWRLPEPLLFAKDFLANLFYLWRQPSTDLIIALDNLNATSAIWLRRLGKTKQVVFYTIDYIPQRFSQPLLNKLYHAMDSFCVRQADYVWNLSPIMTKMRQQKGIEPQYTDKQLIVPIGTHPVTDVAVSRKSNLIIFMGHLREGQGVEQLIEAMAQVVKKIPQAKLRCVGGGPLEPQLKQQIQKLSLESTVELTGFVPSNEEMRRLIQEGTIAVAPYQDVPDNYTRYTDPGKPKEYLAAGLPVVITDVPQFAEVIASHQAGLKVADDPAAISQGIITLLQDPKLKQYQFNAKRLAADYNWDKVFTQAFREMNEPSVK